MELEKLKLETCISFFRTSNRELKHQAILRRRRRRRRRSEVNFCSGRRSGIRQRQRDPKRFSFQKVDLFIIKHLMRGEENPYQIFELDANNTQKDNEGSIPRADLGFWLGGAHVRRKCTGSPIFIC